MSEMRGFYREIRNITRTKKQGAPITGFRDQHGKVIHDIKAVEKEAAQFYSELYRSIDNEKGQISIPPGARPVFTMEDIEDGIRETNFHKGLARDLLDGSVLNLDKELR